MGFIPNPGIRVKRHAAYQNIILNSRVLDIKVFAK